MTDKARPMSLSGIMTFTADGTPDARTLYTVDADGTVHLGDIRTQEEHDRVQRELFAHFGSDDAFFAALVAQATDGDSAPSLAEAIFGPKPED